MVDNIQTLNYKVAPAKAEIFPDLEALWQNSQEADNPTFRPRGGWWPLIGWTEDLQILTAETASGEEIHGVVGLKANKEANVLEARFGTVPTKRHPLATRQLVETALETARRAEIKNIRLITSSKATWLTDRLTELGFELKRQFYAMLRPSAEVTLKPVTSVMIRQMQPGEEVKVLEALNRAWATTWGYNPIPLAALEKDLEGQREGFFIAIRENDSTETIIATVHGIFDSAQQNPDGNSFAWISNVTTDPAARGLGLGRAMLLTGIDYLAQRGAKSVGLGVDGGNPVPVNLYRSEGFEVQNTNQLWEYQLPQ